MMISTDDIFMKSSLLTTFLLTLLIPCSLWANLDGVYYSSFQKNGYACEFNADLIQHANESITFYKWTTECFLDQEQGPKTSVNGPLTFTFLNDREVLVQTPGDDSIYQAKKISLTDDNFFINYAFDSYSEGIVLRYDILINLKLEGSTLKYEMRYLQNDQLIFSDTGIGTKKAP